MSVLVQIRDVPADVHRTLKARAAASGVSLSEYVRGLMRADASRPTVSELSARIRARGSAASGEASEASVREIRERGEAA